MKENNIVVESSLEELPIALFVQTASNYKSKINVKVGNVTVNAKSMMGIISLSVLGANELVLQADGEDEDEALSSLEKILVAI